MSLPRIVVGVDGSAGGEAALAWALDEARRRHAQVDVVHAWHVAFGADHMAGPLAAGVLISLSEDDARAVIDGAVSRADTAGVPAVRKTLSCAGADDALLRAAEGADLLVVGARSHAGISGAVLGSVADDVARRAHCPVAVIPPRA